MKLTFRGGKTANYLIMDTLSKTYQTSDKVCDFAIDIVTQKGLRDLEIELIRNGYTRG